MEQIFADINVCNLALERMFEVVAENRWIALMHHDNLPQNSAEHRVRWSIFGSFSNSLRTLHPMLERLQRMNDALFAMLQAQLRENETRLQFRLFQALNPRLWQPINYVGFHATIHHPMLIYQRFSVNIRLHVTEMQGFCNVFLTQLEEALLFYNTEVFVENTDRAELVVLRSARFSDLQDFENVRQVLANRRQRVFRTEMANITRTLHGR